MLHRVAVVLLACSATLLVGAGPRALEPLTMKGRDALRARAATLTVGVRRRRPRGRVHVPGREVEVGNGWLAAAARVITSAALTTGWPAGAGDAIEVRGPEGVWLPAAVGHLDADLGLVVLDVPGLAATTGESRPPGADAIFPGRPLFAVVEPGAPLWRGEIGPRAEGAYAYYWWVHGSAPLGTPLVDGEGQVTTLVGASGVGDPRRVLALPTDAVRKLLDRSATWSP